MKHTTAKLKYRVKSLMVYAQSVAQNLDPPRVPELVGYLKHYKRAVGVTINRKGRNLCNFKLIWRNAGIDCQFRGSLNLLGTSKFTYPILLFFLFCPPVLEVHPLV